jgi:hypothetical protein
MARKTLAELGQIIVDAVGRDGVESGYKHSADDLAEVGRSALAWGDVEPDGTLT